MFFYAKGDCVFAIVILADGLKMDPEKVKENLEWPTLENVSEIRSFHVLASFYRNFIKNFSAICNSMMLYLIKEKHSGGLVGHFGIDKTLILLKEKYYSTQRYKDV